MQRQSNVIAKGTYEQVEAHMKDGHNLNLDHFRKVATRRFDEVEEKVTWEEGNFTLSCNRAHPDKETGSEVYTLYRRTRKQPAELYGRFVLQGVVQDADDDGNIMSLSIPIDRVTPYEPEERKNKKLLQMAASHFKNECDEGVPGWSANGAKAVCNLMFISTEGLVEIAAVVVIDAEGFAVRDMREEMKPI